MTLTGEKKHDTTFYAFCVAIYTLTSIKSDDPAHLGEPPSSLANLSLLSYRFLPRSSLLSSFCLDLISCISSLSLLLFLCPVSLLFPSYFSVSSLSFLSSSFIFPDPSFSSLHFLSSLFSLPPHTPRYLHRYTWTPNTEKEAENLIV